MDEHIEILSTILDRGWDSAGDLAYVVETDVLIVIPKRDSNLPLKRYRLVEF